MAFGRNKEKKGKKEKVKLSKNAYKQAKNFLSFVKPYSGVYFIGFVFLLLSSGVSISLPILLGQILGADASQMTGEWEIGNIDNIYGVLQRAANDWNKQNLVNYELSPIQ